MAELPGSAERVGQMVGEQWRLERLIGTGATAGVYQACNGRGQRAAVKMLHERFSADAQFKQRFLREARVADHVAHPGVVPIHEAGLTPNGDAYLVMDLLEGQTVEALRVKQGGRLNAAATEDIARQVLSVLSAAHAKGVVHRDIKPANLFVGSDGRLSVLDFGIAHSLEASHGLHSTATGALLGTPAFMAPEQARGRHELVGARTDLWALGATLFTLLTGRHVHVAGTSNELLGLAMSAAAPRLLSVRDDVSPVLAHVVDRALEYDIERRWPSADAMLLALTEPNLVSGAQDTVGSTALDTLSPRGAARRRSGAIGALAAVLVVGVGAGLWSSRSLFSAPITNADPSLTASTLPVAAAIPPSAALAAPPAESGAVAAAPPTPAESGGRPAATSRSWPPPRPASKPSAAVGISPPFAASPSVTAAAPRASAYPEQLLQRRH
jgi:serine/threonine-protein kinase